ncbi:recombinase family protein [Sphingomonas xinjiangensis]|uniref:DNA invertase Pin-like site-specific DNA recombinase n=1 Tax=Sphingomonas xinjiangensis TaxID=643568 RepID=A0A840YBM0_9SPHN|nr:recombinase family protein [Sphingomonas xinjiangensis]MBB5709419.1 DNA invertase Pin-like site-specific DNA recombinase [Sphingomonas xinjiangensis]
MEAILYVRWSTKDQSKGDTERRQIELGASICRQRGWTLAETLIENGKSAYHGRNRAEGGKLYEVEERAARGELAGKVLIVEAMDRLSRQEPLESVTLLNRLAKRGLTICESSTGTIYDAQRISEHWAHLLIAFARAGEAHDSSRIKAKRVSAAWRRTQTDLTTKKGADDPRLCPAWMEVIDGKFTVIEDRADIIRGIFERSANGYGLRLIAKWAQEERQRLGWPKATWHIRNVTNMLHDRRVLGEYQPMMRTENGGRSKAGEAVKRYPAIVTLELWHQVMSGLESRKGTGGPRQKCANVLSNLCRCTYRAPGSNLPCGSRMTLRRQKRGPAQITCSDFSRAGECTCNAAYRYDDILAGVLDNLLSLAMPAPSTIGQHSRVPVLRAELTTKRKRLEEMADRLMEQDDEVLEAAFRRFKAKVDVEAAELKALEAHEEKRTHATDPHAVAEQALALREQMATDADARIKVQSYLGQLIDVIFMDPSDRSATIVVMGGLRVIKLDKHGKVIGDVNTAHMLKDQSIIDKLGREVTLDANVDNWNRVLAGDNPMRLTKLDEVAQSATEAA